ncbi:hypothetical protein LZQ00_03085 [Sphingobacterium sp. SRCM116780]|uniref:hypothetical protein n=1 Tax=Sphingobacterium sp. SRCM116780 TaxID=2907623 RepID=UPI001F384275|nr:hypothetical protein [Sphingobacterium sp. SRCM116780]UIR56809.1 hypothetical protein LZQ00_03085 [Sphingobacterium sp. SRCM116780]
MKDKNSMLFLMLSVSIFFLAYSFSLVEINCDKETITTKRMFMLWKQTAKYGNHDFNFLTIRQSLYGIFVGVDVAIEIQYKRFVLKRFFKTQKIDLFIEETKMLLEKK